MVCHSLKILFSFFIDRNSTSWHMACAHSHVPQTCWKKKESKTYLGTWASEGQQHRQKHQTIYCSNNNQCSQEMKKVSVGRNEVVFLTKLEFLRKFKTSKTWSLRIFTKIGRDRVKDCGIESLVTRFAPNLKNTRTDERVPSDFLAAFLGLLCSQLYLTIKSKSDPASIMTPSSVETAPSTTGENTCSTARCIRWFLSPLLVKNCCKQSKANPGKLSWQKSEKWWLG